MLCGQFVLLKQSTAFTYIPSMTVHLIERNISVALPRGFKLKLFFSTEK